MEGQSRVECYLFRVMRMRCAKLKLVWIVCVAAIVLGSGSAYADFTFGTPVELERPIWYPGDDPQGGCFSRDGLELYFTSNRSGGQGWYDIWVATRETLDAPWSDPINLGPNVNSSKGEFDPAISPDGLEIYFNWYQETPYHIQRCTRPSKDAPWSKPEDLFVGLSAEVSPEGLSLYFSGPAADGTGGDIFVATRATTQDDWGTPASMGPSVNSTSGEGGPSISSDGLALFFTSRRPGGGNDDWDIWVTTRPTTDAEWGPPVYDFTLNQNLQIWDAAISPDGSVLYFESIFTRWQSSITPVVDFTGDSRVDIQDLRLLIEHWGQDDPAYDMGPMPWGDGIVDGADLEVLMTYWGQEVYDPHLLAHWNLDETEGDVAYDSASVNDALIVGDPMWQPEGGHRDGALQFDGLDDHIDTQFRFDLSEGPFHVSAWVKGGAPGQVILSQANGSNWLLLDPVDGTLATEISIGGRFPTGPLKSQAIIADGTWHRVGLAWGGVERSLYVDDVKVATDTTNPPEKHAGNLNIGCGEVLTPGSFWSGLIDDIVVYRYDW